MKRLLLIGLVLAAFCCKAQEGEIIYTHYDCDTLLQAVGYGALVSIGFDVDFDGITDARIRKVDVAVDHTVGFSFSRDWEHPDTTLFFAPYFGQEQGLGHDRLQTGDVIADCVDWRNFIRVWCTWPEPCSQINGVRIYIGTRKKVGDDFIYGWLDVELHLPYWGEQQTLFVHLYGTSFCTIPNYPLRAGQTSLDWDVDENETPAFASVHPNPIDGGQLTVLGNDLRETVVFNTLGQQVAKAQGEGGTMHIDLTGLPAGIYLVSVTDNEGRRCVRKVVKQ